MTAEPYHGYARVAAAFHPALAAPDPAQAPAGGIAPGALIDPAARVGPGCRVAAGAVVEADAELGPRCRIAANAVIGAGVVVGADCHDRAGRDAQPLPGRRPGGDPRRRADRAGRLRLRA